MLDYASQYLSVLRDFCKLLPSFIMTPAYYFALGMIYILPVAFAAYVITYAVPKTRNSYINRVAGKIAKHSVYLIILVLSTVLIEGYGGVFEKIGPWLAVLVICGWMVLMVLVVVDPTRFDEDTPNSKADSKVCVKLEKEETICGPTTYKKQNEGQKKSGKAPAIAFLSRLKPDKAAKTLSVGQPDSIQNAESPACPQTDGGSEFTDYADFQTEKSEPDHAPAESLPAQADSDRAEEKKKKSRKIKNSAARVAGKPHQAFPLAKEEAALQSAPAQDACDSLLAELGIPAGDCAAKASRADEEKRLDTADKTPGHTAKAGRKKKAKPQPEPENQEFSEWTDFDMLFDC